MAIRTVRLEDDPILRKISKPVKEITPRIMELIEDMIDTMEVENGVGIAAPQVGVLKRIFVILDEEGVPTVYINPEILEMDGSDVQAEGCLSVKSRNFGAVKRPTYIKVRAMDLQMNTFEIELRDFIAREFCHEFDHLNGILYTDKLEPSNPLNEEGIEDNDLEEFIEEVEY